jgi:pimeloyl-ACP methyl ester carboxylesterase
MNRLLFLISLLAGCILSQLTTPAQAQRGAVFVHGLNSDNNFWAHSWIPAFAGYTGSRLMANRSNGSYATKTGVVRVAAAAGNSIYFGNENSVNLGGPPANQTIYLGHSMGGVVGRHLDVTNNVNQALFGGIITAGSPLDGAHTANSGRNGDASRFLVSGLELVTQGPLRQLGGTAWGAGGVIADEVFHGLDGWFDLMGTYKWDDQGTTDLMEGSAYMNSTFNNNLIRDTQTNTPKIHIYGNEEAPIFWRFASQTIGNGDDNQYVGVGRTIGDVSEAFMWTNYGAAVLSAATLRFGEAAYHVWCADGWSQGMNWCRYDSENGYNHIVGTDIPATRTITIQTFDWNGFNNCMNQHPNATYQDYITCQQQYTAYVPYTYYAPVNGQSDAFIRASSQIGYNSAWSNNATKIEARTVNHFEMNRHPVMRDIFNGIFAGGYQVDNFFVTR